jgi:hypothetical protein
MRLSAWALVTLGLSVAALAPVSAQDQQQQRPKVELGQNFPNPFNPETTIPFSLPEEMFADGAKPVVSLRIYNVLAQLVAIPILQGSGEQLESVRVEWNGTGRYQAYWDGKVLQTGREAASGVYVYQLTVNGQRFTGKMTIVK